jgi:hypothetical protein
LGTTFHFSRGAVARSATDDAVQEVRQTVTLTVLVRTLGRILVNDIPRAATTGRFGVVHMGRVRMVGIMWFHSAFAVGYLARGNVPCASTADGVQPQGLQVGSPFGLVQFFDELLRGLAAEYVSIASTTGGVRRLAGAGARTRKGAGTGVWIVDNVAFAAATNRMQLAFTLMSIVDGYYEVAIVAATTLFGPKRGRLIACVVPAEGISGGRADVPSPTASGGNDRAGIGRRDGFPATGVRKILRTCANHRVSGWRTNVSGAATAGRIHVTATRD